MDIYYFRSKKSLLFFFLRDNHQANYSAIYIVEYQWPFFKRCRLINDMKKSLIYISWPYYKTVCSEWSHCFV